MKNPCKGPVIDKLTMEELNRLTVENVTLKEQIKDSEISRDTFSGNDEKVKYYTVLPSFLTLLALYNLVAPFIPDGNRSSLTKFQIHLCFDETASESSRSRSCLQV